MANVTDVDVYQKVNTIHHTKGKATRETLWHGKIHVSPPGLEKDTVEANIKKLSEKYKTEFAKVAKEYGGTFNIPAKRVRELQDSYAERIREVMGCDPRDGHRLVADKTYDIIALAKKFSITPGDDGWVERIVELVEQDKHLGNNEQ